MPVKKQASQNKLVVSNVHLLSLTSNTEQWVSIYLIWQKGNENISGDYHFLISNKWFCNQQPVYFLFCNGQITLSYRFTVFSLISIKASSYISFSVSIHMSSNKSLSEKYVVRSSNAQKIEKGELENNCLVVCGQWQFRT